jgi:hypothetical protein
MHRQAIFLTPLLLLAACGSGQQHSVRLLDRRLEARLAPEIAAGRAVVQSTDTGARVTLLDTTPFPTGPKALGDLDPDIRAEVIEGLLDPSLMRVQVSDTSALPPYQQEARVRKVQDYFTTNGLGQVLAPPGTPPQADGPAGLNITIDLQCPPPNGRTGYGDGRSLPVCD